MLRRRSCGRLWWSCPPGVGHPCACLQSREETSLVLVSRGTVTSPSPSGRGGTTLLLQRAPQSCTVFVMTPPMNTPVRVGETIEGSRTMRNRPYPVLKCSKKFLAMPTPPRRRSRRLATAAAAAPSPEKPPPTRLPVHSFCPPHFARRKKGATAVWPSPTMPLLALGG